MNYLEKFLEHNVECKKKKIAEPQEQTKGC